MAEGASAMTGLYSAALGAHASMEADRFGLLRRVRHHDATFTIDTNEEVGLVLTLSEAHRVERRMDGGVCSPTPRVGTVTLLPPGCRAGFSITGAARVLMLRLPWPGMADWLAEDYGVDPDRVELRPRLHVDDPVLARLVYGMAAEKEADGASAAMRAVSARLLTSHASRPPERLYPLARGGLAPARLRRVLGLIEAGLPGPLPLAALAVEAGVSPFHFAREFRHATGIPPHRYVVRRRVDRAMLLLARRDLSVADVARRAGFTHASHLARHMRQRVGLTPEGFRSHVLP